jgi:hypothetical protein
MWFGTVARDLRKKREKTKVQVLPIKENGEIRDLTYLTGGQVYKDTLSRWFVIFIFIFLDWANVRTFARILLGKAG